MKPKSIGIVGGAGPLAGVMLVEQIVRLAGSLYKCHRDGDFPKIFLLSFPFSEMLSEKIDRVQIEKELDECLKQLKKNGAEILAIACNTLHAFLGENENLPELIHLPKTVATEITPTEIPLVLCTSTSTKFGIHRKFFPCDYPNTSTQTQIDTIIDLILKGEKEELIANDLLELLKYQKHKTIILGCTELSLFRDKLSRSEKTIIDPMAVTSKKILEESFLKGSKTFTVL